MLDIPLAEKRPPQIHMQTRYISCFKYFTLSSVSVPYRLSVQIINISVPSTLFLLRAGTTIV